MEDHVEIRKSNDPRATTISAIVALLHTLAVVVGIGFSNVNAEIEKLDMEEEKE